MVGTYHRLNGCNPLGRGLVLYWMILSWNHQEVGKPVYVDLAYNVSWPSLGVESAVYIPGVCMTCFLIRNCLHLLRGEKNRREIMSTIHFCFPNPVNKINFMAIIFFILQFSSFSFYFSKILLTFFKTYYFASSQGFTHIIYYLITI